MKYLESEETVGSLDIGGRSVRRDPQHGIVIPLAAGGGGRRELRSAPAMGGAAQHEVPVGLHK